MQDKRILAKVALLECDRYNLEDIEKKLREGLELLGGERFIRQLVPPGSSVFLKPNLMCSEPAGSHVITHYIIFEAVVRVLKDYTSHISFGDGHSFADSVRIAERAGLMEIAKRYGVSFDDLKDSLQVKISDALLCHGLEVARAPYEADVLISLPKLKTHALAFLTGAIKNQFGCIPGLQKSAWHARAKDPSHFNKMLLDLNTVMGTRFAILDGITAMDGNGPKNGNPFPLHALIMGACITAVDSVAARLIGYNNPLEVPVLRDAHQNCWGAVLEDEIQVLGSRIDILKAVGFKLARQENGLVNVAPSLLERFIDSSLLRCALRDTIVPNPVLIPEKCKGCRRCSDVCPQKPDVINFIKKRDSVLPHWNLNKCIRCFCCQEFCPEGAIEVRYSKLGKMINAIKRR